MLPCTDRLTGCPLKSAHKKRALPRLETLLLTVYMKVKERQSVRQEMRNADCRLFTIHTLNLPGKDPVEASCREIQPCQVICNIGILSAQLKTEQEQVLCSMAFNLDLSIMSTQST